MRTLTWVGVALVACCASQNATAAASKVFAIQRWTGTAHVNDKTKQLEQCAASANNDSGVAVTYTVDRNFAWKLSFTGATWDFVVGHSFNVSLRIGEEQTRAQRAIVTAAKTFEVAIDDPIGLFERLRTSQSLRVQAGGLSLAFDVADSDEVLPALVRCMAQQMSRRTPATPAAAARPLALNPSVDAAGESQALATDMLARIGINDVRYVPAKEIPVPYRADVAWKTGAVGIGGAVATQPSTPAASVEALTAALFNSREPVCRGSMFVITASETVDQTPMARVFTACRTLEGTASSYHLVLPRASSGSHLVSVIGSGYGRIASQPVEELDGKIRAVIVGVMARQRQESAKQEGATGEQ
jgi:hypothetical protein